MKNQKIKKAILSGDLAKQQALLAQFPSDFIVSCVMLDALWVLQSLDKQINWSTLALIEICPLHYATSKKMLEFWLQKFTKEQLLLSESNLGDAIAFQEDSSQMKAYLQQVYQA